jgi:inner membrane protein involved in colicin E2 resistance
MWKRFISGDIYRDIPTPLLFVLGPLLGLVYLFLIPLALVANLVLLPFRKARKAGTSESFSAPRPNQQRGP